MTAEALQISADQSTLPTIASSDAPISQVPDASWAKRPRVQSGWYPSEIKKYLSEATEWFKADHDGESDLHIALRKPESEVHKQIAQLLIDNATDLKCLDMQNDGGTTPLMIAVRERQIPLITRLRLAGANPNIVDFRGNTAVHFAVFNQDCDSLMALCRDLDSEELLAYRGRDGFAWPVHEVYLDSRNCDGKTALYCAVERGCSRLVTLLLCMGADPNVSEYSSGFSPLHLAVQCPRDQCFSLLLSSSKLDISQRTYAGYTALELAERVRASEQIEELLLAGATRSSRSMQLLEFADDDDVEYDEEELD